MRIFTNYCFFIILSITPACKAISQNLSLDGQTKKAYEKVDIESFKAHIAYLADDKLKGRLPGTEGYTLAMDYVIEKYKQLGLLPAGDKGEFTQKMTIRHTQIENNSVKAVLKDKLGNEDSLTYAKDIFIRPNPLKTKVKLDAPLVFVGYGFEYGNIYSDYTSIDVKGKIVVALGGMPSLNLPSTLAAHFSNVNSKAETALAHGAVGFILVNVAQTLLQPISMNIAINDNKTRTYGSGRSDTKTLDFFGTISTQTLKSWFLNTGISLPKTMESLNATKPASCALPNTLSVEYTNEYKDFDSYNIVGKIEGSDKTLKNEYVVQTAHLDHLGIRAPINGDSIYNGAHDNASGVASLIEIARIYKKLETKPKRSVLIVMVTGEEMGLLGSSYFANNPTVPVSQIVADVNTDMPTLIAPLLSVVPLGAEHSNLDKNVAFACEQLGLEIHKDPLPSENRFIRSDQYSFVMQGIPALHIKYGIKTKDPSVDLVKMIKEWTAKHYHKPSDDLNSIFDYSAAQTYIQLNFLISYSIAQTVERPKWREGDYFGERAKTIKMKQ